jgi:hypothetical protein
VMTDWDEMDATTFNKLFLEKLEAAEDLLDLEILEPGIINHKVKTIEEKNKRDS